MQKPQELIDDYLDTFARANPGRPAPLLNYDNGWYVFRAEQGYVRSRHRRDGIERIRTELRRRIKEAAERAQENAG